MGDYIKRSDVEAEFVGSMSVFDGKIFVEDALARIADIPSANVVEVVRCGECKHMKPNGECTVLADSTIRPSVSDFCSYGERKEE